MKRQKYIRFKRFGGIVVWDEMTGVTHADMARLIQIVSGCEPCSAGFVDTDANGKLICYGNSVSLRLQAQEGDSKALEIQLGLTEAD